MYLSAAAPLKVACWLLAGVDFLTAGEELVPLLDFADYKRCLFGVLARDLVGVLGADLGLLADLATDFGFCGVVEFFLGVTFFGEAFAAILAWAAVTFLATALGFLAILVAGFLAGAFLVAGAAFFAFV